MQNFSREILKIKDLRVQYPLSNEWMLKGVNLTIEKNQRLALIGSSGSGKSTIAKALLQLLPEDSLCKGEILFEGENLIQLKEEGMQKIRGKNIGLVFQDPMTRLNPLMTIGQQIIDTLQAHYPQKNFAWFRHRAEELLSRVGIHVSRFRAYPHELSGGMRQRVGIALAISLNPLLVVADEPTTSLDVVLADQMMSELSKLCKEIGAALLLITHDLALAARWCSHIAIVNKGEIVEDGLTKNILSSPSSLIGKRLLKAAKKRELSHPNLSINKKVILEVNNLRCWHQGRGWPWNANWIKSVQDVSFSLHENEILGVIGVSGCGKSTLCRALLGLHSIRGGEVKLLGEDLLNMPKTSKRVAMKSIQMVFQDPFASLNPQMTVGEAIADPILIHNIMPHVYAKEKVRELLSQVGLIPIDTFQNRLPKELSGGQQQRVSIARALALNPKVLICDESVSMLDPEIQLDILKLLTSLQKKLGLGILFITHDLYLAQGFCQRVIVLDKGLIIEQGNGKELFQMPQTFLSKKLADACPKLLLSD